MSDPGIEKDYYSILGASETASQDEIERLYKRLAFRHHPDRGGDAEEMKLINEAYWVLGNAATRRTYDARRWQGKDTLGAAAASFSSASVPLRNGIPERLTRAVLLLLAGLIFLFVVRIYYIRFMWPILVVAVVIVMFGVWKVHGVMVFARTNNSQTAGGHHVWVQELAFWSIVGVGAYGIYLLMNAM